MRKMLLQSGYSTIQNSDVCLIRQLRRISEVGCAVGNLEWRKISSFDKDMDSHASTCRHMFVQMSAITLGLAMARVWRDDRADAGVLACPPPRTAEASANLREDTLS